MKQVQYKVHTQQGVLLNANESSKNLSAAIRKEIQDAIFDIEFNRYPDDACQKLCEAYGSRKNHNWFFLVIPTIQPVSF